MARNTYSNALLDGSTDGLSRLAQAIGGGQQAYQGGFDQAATAQTKIAQALAQIREQNAVAGVHDAAAAETRAKTGVLQSRPGLFDEQVANAAGSDIPTVNAYRKQLQTGIPAATATMGPPTEDGHMGAALLPPEVTTKIGRALQQFLPMLANGGDLPPEQMAKAAQLFRESGLSDDIIAGRVDRNAVGGAQAAVAGKPVYNTSADGAVLDQFTGGLNTNNPMARSTIGLRGAQAGEASARGRLATAQAGEVGAPKFDAGSGTIVDARTATARPVVGPDGKPIGPKQGAGATLNQEQANALGFGSRMQASDKILGSLARDGVNQPGAIYRAAGALPIVGGVAESLANVTQSDQQQEVDQAQRDFINATLRRESGASISPGEFDNARKQYFPQPGDKGGVLAQKAANRKRVIQSMFAAVPENMRTLPDLPGAAPAPGLRPAPGANRNVTVDY